jgi:cell division protein FtsZ
MAKERTTHRENELLEVQAVLKVVGVGGGGGNAVNRMIEVGVQGVEFIAMNTDAQVLNKSRAPIKMQLGVGITRGLGAGGNPEAGRSAAEESRHEIRKVLEGADLVFITAGLGGGTGTGAAPIIAEIAQELGALTIAVVTKPFKFEGPRRWKVAEEGAQLLRKHVDAMIVVQNDRLIDVSERTTTMTEAFRMADDVLRSGVQGISDIINYAGEINVDFADVRTIFENAGTALMGIGKGTGENRMIQAVQEASTSKLLESSIYGARRLLVNITTGEDIGIFEVPGGDEPAVPDDRPQRSEYYLRACHQAGHDRCGAGDSAGDRLPRGACTAPGGGGASQAAARTAPAGHRPRTGGHPNPAAHAHTRTAPRGKPDARTHETRTAPLARRP